jgi:hypothetical protein
MSGGMIKNFRIMILLYVLLMVAVSAWWTKARSTDWNAPLVVAIYPINGDGREATTKYIDKLDKDTFTGIEEFFIREAKRHQLTIKKPVDIDLAKQINEQPPKPPGNHASVLSIMVWSLKMRYWSWSIDNYDHPKDIQVFVIYFDPKENQRLAHSLGLQKGLIGVVNAFADRKMTKQNNIVIAHEILHTVGASDKYDPRTNQPLFPIGFAEPDKDPSFPQNKAEVMAGRIPVDLNKAEPPRSLKKVLLGKATAIEIRWLAIDSK